ncbi:MAG: Sapep family Mn(2+)-dependent dipeptidase [Myxococcota bacterium]
MRCFAAVVVLLAASAWAGDSRCKGSLKERAARFSKQALPTLSDPDRHAQYVKACALDEVVALASRLIEFPTVSSEASAEKSEAISAMGRFLAGWAKGRGLSFRVVGKNDVFEVGWGEGKPALGLLMHGDVVPAPPTDWKRPPFRPVVENGRLYGRGAEDDKGPIAAALVAMAFARDLGLVPKGKVLVIIGNGEESDWDGMKAYAEKEPKPTHVLSVDSSFPIVVAESGFVAWGLEAEVGEPSPGDEGVAVAQEALAGEFLTQVPGRAELKLSPRGKTTLEALEALVKKAAAARPGATVEVKREGALVVVRAQGRSVHSSTAEQGHNALWDLAAVSAQLPLVKNGISVMLGVVARRFDQDHWGERLGLAYADALMGKLLVAPTLLRVKDGKVTLEVNMRRPRGKDTAAFTASLEAAGKSIVAETNGRVRPSEKPYVGEPHVADTSGPLVSTLKAIYRRHRPNEEPKLLSIRGGTYARLFPGAVDFGPSLPGEPYTGHSHDEWIGLGNLELLTRMLAEVVTQR